MEGGAAHGITEGAEFNIYKEAESSIRSAPLGVLIATKVGPFTTTLDYGPESSKFPLLDNAHALMIKAGKKQDLRLNIAMKEQLLDVFKTLAQLMDTSISDTRNIQFVEMDGNPHFRIDFDNGNVVFENLDPLVNKYGLVRMPFTVDNIAEDIQPIIRAAAHFKWHVNLTNPKHTLQNEVELHFMEAREIEGEYDEYYHPVLEIGKNIHNAGEVYISEDPEKLYAIKIVNNTPLALYPSLFFFDNSSLEIRKCRRLILF